MNTNNLIFHYQTVQHNVNGIFLHEAFFTSSGELYSINPVPVEVTGDTEQEIEERLRAMETDSLRHKPIKIEYIHREMLRWEDELAITKLPKYEDDVDALENDYYDSDDKVLDLIEFMKRNK